MEQIFCDDDQSISESELRESVFDLEYVSQYELANVSQIYPTIPDYDPQKPRPGLNINM